jgi:hypothetical protein
VCNRRELVKTPAKKVTDTSGQRKINQSQHSQILDLPPASAFAQDFGPAGISANRKRSIFFVKQVRISLRDEPVNAATLHPTFLLRLDFVGPQK